MPERPFLITNLNNVKPIYIKLKEKTDLVVGLFSFKVRIDMILIPKSYLSDNQQKGKEMKSYCLFA